MCSSISSLARRLGRAETALRRGLTGMTGPSVTLFSEASVEVAGPLRALASWRRWALGALPRWLVSYMCASVHVLSKIFVGIAAGYIACPFHSSNLRNAS